MNADVTIGADPELCFTSDLGHARHAQYVLKDKTYKKRFGVDGALQSAELRPKPSTDPLKVVTNIRRDMYDTLAKSKKVGLYNWNAGSFCDGQRLGGHIHFGHPALTMFRDYMDSQGDIVMTYWSDAFSLPILRFLNTFLGLPSVLLENKFDARNRRSQPAAEPLRRLGYGYFDKRVVSVKEWGFEYRPVASWLTSPYVAAGVLSLAKVVMDAYLDLYYPSREMPDWYRKYDFTIDDLNVYNEKKLRKAYEGISSEIKLLPRYSEFKPQLEFIDFLIKDRLTWFPVVSLKEAWGLPKTVQEKPRPFITIREALEATSV